MVSPSRKRRAARQLVREKSCSVRAACRSLRLSRSSYYYEPKKGDLEERLVKRLKELRKKHARYGYRRMTALLKRERAGGLTESGYKGL